MNVFKILFACIQALLPLIGFGFIALVLYTEILPPFHIIGAIICVGLGLYLSWFVFNMINRRGAITTMSGNNASYDLDDLEPTPGSDFIKLSPKLLAEDFKENKFFFKMEVTVSIWGDSIGKKLNDKHILKSVIYKEETAILILEFYDDCLLKIKKPGVIYYSNNYLKIIHAREILWQITGKTKSFYQYSYLNTGKTIKTKSNTNWKSHPYDFGIGMNALYLQG